ncbi:MULTISPECIES: hypothetical protein [unclassified Aureimonas]|uniref:hypothetical protein n=1 Tax=unclassified Aureimonas TaxID=2615206 RepID=UPI000720CF93|nr:MULTISPECIES: hypothetical protein [unclassified Aureimonas]ALN73848.1 hypothetical protein M673_14065 [Aureimonas sp. AU20]
MINRFASTEDTLRTLQLAQWRATWAEPTRVDTASTPLASPGSLGVAAASAMAASVMPLAFAAALPSSSSGGAYAISPAGAMNAYRDGRD